MKDYIAYLESNAYSQKTIDCYVTSVRLYLRDYELTHDDMRRWFEKSLANTAPSTTATRIYALNNYAAFVGADCRLKPITVEVPMYVEDILTETHYRKLLDGLESDGDWEWYSVVRLLACTGLRIAEAVQVSRKDIENRKKSIYGKGSRFREVWFPKDFRCKVLPHLPEGRVIRHDDGYVRTKLHRLAKKYGVPRKACHPHAFRALFARKVYEKTKDIRLVSNLLGHKSISTTTKYLRVSSRGMSRRISQIVDW